MQIFDFHANMVIGGFRTFSGCPNYLAWSGAGGFFAARISSRRQSFGRCLECLERPCAVLGPPESTLDALHGCERHNSRIRIRRRRHLFGDMEEWPSARMTESLAVVLEYKGDWADDSLLITDARSLRGRDIFQAHGHITDVSWMSGSGQVVYCAGGQSYRLTAATMDREELSFAAELCVCHPFLPICVCFSSWLKNSAEGRLCVFDLERREMLDECAADGHRGATLEWRRLEGARVDSRWVCLYVRIPDILNLPGRSPQR